MKISIFYQLPMHIYHYKRFEFLKVGIFLVWFIVKPFDSVLP